MDEKTRRAYLLFRKKVHEYNALTFWEMATEKGFIALRQVQKSKRIFDWLSFGKKIAEHKLNNYKNGFKPTYRDAHNPT